MINCPNKQVKVPQTAYERAFSANNKASPSALAWLIRESSQRGKHIHHAEVRGGLRAHLWMVMTQLQGLCSNTMVATGTDVMYVLQKAGTKLSVTTKLEKIDILQ